MRIAEPVSTVVSTAGELSTMRSRVDPEGARRMMEMLVNLYADRRLAVAREYVSNAVDATRVAGSSEPVAVTTPTLIEPNLVVTDRGSGMSIAEVEATFLAFAASSKRDSNDMIGGLGVGAKSAWALAESFLVDTVKDGRRTTVRAARNLEHQVLVSGVATDLPNGTTVIVPVEVGSDGDVWRCVVNEVASAHDEGLVLVDGKPVESLGGGLTRIGPVSCRRVERSDRSMPSVVVRSGGTLFSSVPEVTKRVVGTTGLVGCVLELPIGSFDHTPSRESVIASTRTLAAVDAALRQYRVAYEALAQRIANLAVTDVGAAADLRADTLGAVGTTNMLPIPFQVGVPAHSEAWTVRTSSGRPRWERVGIGGDVFDAATARAQFKSTVVVTGVPAGRVLSRFATFLAKKHHYVRRVIGVPEGQETLELDVFGAGGRKVAQRWHIGAQTKGIAAHYTFEQWTAALAASRGTRAAVGGYACVVVDRDGGAPRSEVLSGSEIAALGLPVVYTHETPPIQPASVRPASVMVRLGKRKPGPLLAAVPTAITVDVWLERQFEAVTAGWSQAQQLAGIYLSSWQCEYCQPVFEVGVAALAGHAAVHPQHALLTQIAEIVQAAETMTEAQAAALRGLHGCSTAVAQLAKIEALKTKLVRAYPLLLHLSRWDDKEVCAHYTRYITHTPPADSSNAA